ncbi:MAG: hypothetical protein MZV64_10110 [Ignavibacteriales bacterium]|nr:hypothetical protein [Ignavibacteriales bacterium]
MSGLYQEQALKRLTHNQHYSLYTIFQFNDEKFDLYPAEPLDPEIFFIEEKEQEGRFHSALTPGKPLCHI